MKKIVTALFAVALLAGLGACANNGKYVDNGSSNASSIESHGQRK
jgi:hypothetical protein